ncbi:MAG: LuxR C-terminal-related transcriptional regulator [Saprospiraceae bacterium]|nr:LuxR C-terminal-related transcriptional regulator [Saprospiraceae bacterium]
MQASNITKRELEVLQLISEGLRAHEIAKALFLSPYTINDHRKSIMAKLDAKNVANLVFKSFHLGLLEA